MSIASRLNRLESATAGDVCRSCGWPLPADSKPSPEFLRQHVAPIDLENAGPMPAPHRCPTCGRAFDFFAITLDGDRQAITADGDDTADE